MNGPKQASTRFCTGSVRMRRSDRLDGAIDVGARAAQRFAEFGQRCVAFGNQPIAPALSIPKQLPRSAVIRREPIERRADRFRIDAAHQFADQLFLASQCAVRTHRLGGRDSLGQTRVEIDAVELFPGQSDELLAQCLKCLDFTFPRRFTGL